MWHWSPSLVAARPRKQVTNEEIVAMHCISNEEETERPPDSGNSHQLLQPLSQQHQKHKQVHQLQPNKICEK